jgi:protease secretion system outer membrane protein
MESMRDLAQARYLYLLSRLRLKALAGLADKASIDEVNAYLKN